jgi:hypothetical protein
MITPLPIFDIIDLHQITLQSQGLDYVLSINEESGNDHTQAGKEGGVSMNSMNAMNAKGHELEQAGTHIWLRYATQFTQGNRSYTVEMGIPVPLGASVEQREQLLREAEAGMNQLTQSVERRVAQMLHQPPSSTTPASITTPKPAAAPPTRTAPVPVSPPPQSPTAAIVSAAASAPPTAALPANRPPAEPKEAARRPTGGLSMPRMVASGSDLTMPEFISNLRENLGLSPKEAMMMLRVRSLSGLNLRDAYEQLQSLVAQTPTEADTADTGNTTSSASSPVEQDTSAKAKVLPPTASPTQASSPQPLVIEAPAHAIGERGVAYGDGSRERERATLSRFEEEADEIDGDASVLDDELEDLPRELTQSERAHARTIVNRMREMRGATLANAARLQVLRNLVDQQLSDGDLHDLLRRVWGVTSLKKLKVDQTEFLISWAKQDDFVDEAEMVLLLLEEEG